MIKNKYIRAVLVALTTLTFVSTNITTYAIQRSDLEVQIKKETPIDVVLAVGKSSTDVTNFKTDLTNKLVSSGINPKRINISAIQSTEINAKSDFTWEKYDHEKGTVSGNDIYFYGYTSYGYSDFWYNDNQMKGKKTFTFVLDESQVKYHSFYGGGFMFGTKKYSDNSIEGYVLLFDQSTASIQKIPRTNMSTYSNTDGNFSYKKLFSVSKSKGVHNIKTEVNGTEVKVWDNNNLIISYTLPDQLGEGFGIVADHNNHACSETSTFIFKNLVMNTESSKQFSEIIRQPSWKENSARFLVDLEDEKVSDFDNSSKSGAILPRLLNQEINYIGWGNTNNKSQLENFISRNNNNGKFIYNTNYAQGVTDISNYILSKLDGKVLGDPAYLIAGVPVSVTSNPQNYANNTADNSFPQGKWKYNHDYTFFDNNTGQSPTSGIWQNNINYNFDKVGKYELFYGNDNPTPRFVYVHRRPIANYMLNIAPNGDKYNISVSDKSYDPDLQVKDAQNKGIAEREWLWKSTTATNWNKGLPTSLPKSGNYLIQLRVKDNQGAWSKPESRYVTTTGIATQPIATFDISSNYVSKYDTLNFSNTSYDPAGFSLNNYEWGVYKNGSLVWSRSMKDSSNPIDSFRSIGLGAGEYKIGLKVKNSAGLVSEEYLIPITVTEDTTHPEAIIDNTSCEWTANNQTINFSFTDRGGSGFSGYRYAINQSTTYPTTGWSNWINSSSGQITLQNEGVHYVFIEAKDNAGNVMKRTLGAFKIDKTIPNSTITQSTSDKINRVALTVSATDNLSGVKQITLPNGNIVAGSKVNYTVGENDTYTFIITDNAGNSSTKSITITNIDNVAPIGSVTANITNWTNTGVILTANASDDNSGVKGITLPNGTVVANSVATYTANSNGTYTFIITDNAGNTANVSYNVTNIDKVLPTLNLSLDSTRYTAGNVVINAVAYDEDSGVKQIKLPDGRIVNGSNASYSVTANGNYSFEVMDIAGNIKVTTITVDNIMVLDTASKINHIEYKLEGATVKDWATYNGNLVISNEGVTTIRAKAIDNAGNVSAEATSTVRIDKTKPINGKIIIISK